MTTLSTSGGPDDDTPAIRRAVVIGCGLIGTSVALALRREGVRVALDDHDPRALAQAVSMGAGVALRRRARRADVVVIATPPSAVVSVLREAQSRGLGAVYTDVASAKARILAEAGPAGCDLTSYVPGHPMAGREVSGPAAARAGLFEGRTWAVCPHPDLSPHALRVACVLAAACGAEVTLLAPDAHDQVTAAVSHVPLVLSAALAGRFARAEPQALALAGTGLQDMTRIAASPVDMWRDILEHNAGSVASLLEDVASDLAQAVAALRAAGAPGRKAVAELLSQGNAGHARIVDACSARERRAQPAS
ncbi:prephenate dehydrogenase/arogenate dehydrogenase family protein [Nonomuraea sp. MG754425]|uniref:prephenate dehydrogenase n=1 Tax=Nonomuraea sp. MG754425 TaxID=2570319 RepID=UPI001F2A3A52|nr:prephenate dehydrogenase [Nonomuraea sp. MG754425]MCF6469943.1 prephenate dehydrogenase/arogenate dehydrogenase family protein [Nonomuraea sp. MG754425]